MARLAHGKNRRHEGTNVKLTPRETTLAVGVAVAALIAVTLMAAKPYMARWNALRDQQRQLQREISLSQRLVAQKDTVTAQFDKLKGLLPTHPENRNMKVHWQTLMQKIAEKNDVSINKSKPGEEKKQGSVYEVPIECSEWDSDLEHLTHFLFDLESAGAMLDVRQLSIRPQGGGGKLTGRFSLYCAYTREDRATTEPEKEGESAGKASGAGLPTPQERIE